MGDLPDEVRQPERKSGEFLSNIFGGLDELFKYHSGIDNFSNDFWTLTSASVNIRRFTLLYNIKKLY